jgi:peptidoglycan/LPS O-acetylase OafA/YrhL
MSLIAPLTSIRSVLALWVVLFHFHSSGLLANNWLAVANPIWQQGYLGVDGFFILSGFIMMHVHERDFSGANFLHTGQAAPAWRGALRYWALRVARVFPLHYAMLLIYLGIFILYALLHKTLPLPERYQLIDFAYNVLNIHAWGVCSTINWNSPAWSISAEWAAYLAFPFLVPLFQVVRSPWLWAGLAFTGLGLFLTSTGLQLSELTINGGVVRIACEFTLGMALHRWWGHRQATPAMATLGLATGVGLLCGGAWLGNQVVGYMLAPVAMAVLLVTLASLPTNWAKHFGHPTLLYLGEISYATYLVHILCIQGFQMLHLNERFNERFNEHFAANTVLNSGINTGATVLLLGGITLAAALLNRYIEVPARRYLRLWIDQHLPSLNAKRPLVKGDTLTTPLSV